MARATIVLPVNATAEFNRGSTASPPSTPTSFTATAGNTENNLSWDSVSNIIRYHIYFNTTGSVDNTDTLIQVESGNTSYTHTGLTNGTTYYYKVAAVGPGGESTLSSETSATPSTYSNEYSVLFGGTDEYGTFSAPVDTSLSFSFWMKSDASSSGFPRLIDMPAYKLLYEPGNTRAEFRSFWSGTTGRWRFPTSSIQANTWTHVVISYDATATTNDPDIYVNGTIVSETELATPTGTIVSNSGTGYLAAENDLSDFYTGNLDEVAIWDGTLTSDEVTDIYNTANPPDLSTVSTTATLLHWWRMGDGDSFPTITDQVGSNNITLVNMESGDIEEDVP